MKKILSLLLVTLLLATLAGCGGGAGGSSSAAADSPTPPTESVSEIAEEPNDKPYEGTTITHLGYSGAYQHTIQPRLDEFTELTGIKVNYQQLDVAALSQKNAIVAAAGGSEVDVYSLAPLGESLLYINNGWVEPLDPFIENSPEFDIADYFESSMATCTSDDGTIYMIPTATEQQVAFYDKSKFEEKNLEIPETLEELMAVAEALTDRADDYSGITIRGSGYMAVTQFSSFLRGFGGDFFKDGKATINTPEAKEAFYYYADLLNNYGPAGPSGIGGVESTAYFNQGKAAIRIDCSVQYATHINPTDSVVADNVGYFVVPDGPGGHSPFSTSPYSFGISSGSKNKEAAWEFIKWACSKEMDVLGQIEGNLSARKSTWDNPEANVNLPAELAEVITATMAIGHPTDRPYLVQGAEARTIVGNMIDLVIAGAPDFEDQLDKANEELQAILDSEPT